MREQERVREKNWFWFILEPKGESPGAFFTKIIPFCEFERPRPIPCGWEQFLEVPLPSLEVLLKSSWRIASWTNFQQAKEYSGEFVNEPVELGARRMS